MPKGLRVRSPLSAPQRKGVNGVKVNRHRKKRNHIDRMKKRYLKNPFMGSTIGMSYAQYIACFGKPDREIKYWQACFLSGPRKYAKGMTSGMLRRKWRKHKSDLIRMGENDLEDFDRSTSSGGWYRRHYDYAWTVW